VGGREGGREELLNTAFLRTVDVIDVPADIQAF